MDEETRNRLIERRDAILTALMTCTFTDEELQGIYEELAELSAVLGPDMEDQHG